MGRKIPAKKHRGVKDPLLQQAKRLESLKGKINAPPKDPDDQPMPRSLITLFGLNDTNKKKNNKQHVTRTINTQNKVQRSCAHDNPVRRLRRTAGESGRDFSLRINSAVKALHNPTETLQYPLDLEADDVKGQRMAELRQRRARKKRRAAASPDSSERLTRTQKLALKKKAKKTKALEERQERQELVYERVAFGDVASAPPALPAPRRPAQPVGQRQLLLTRPLAGGAADGAAERARREAVAAYRALKAAQRARQ